MKQFRQTKIIATLGPATSTEKAIDRLLTQGVNVIRLNMSHGDHQSHIETIKKVRAVAKKIGQPVGILGDLQGPKIRVGKIQHNEMQVKKNDIIKIVNQEIEGADGVISTGFPNLYKEVSAGSRILIDDGFIELKVTTIEQKSILCQVLNDGIISNHKGLNIPNIKLPIPAMTEKDSCDLEMLLENEVDFVALSFVRDAEDIRSLKKQLRSLGHAELPIIAKIEKPEAMLVIDDIIDESYGVIIARGDLGIEANIEKVPTIQKQIIKKCNLQGKPVVVATQMLNSMINSPVATRAEVSDVANAILDGADALMLSGETAMGKYPFKSIETMLKIIHEAESSFMIKNFRKYITDQYATPSVELAISKAAVKIGAEINAQCIVCLTHSGNTAKSISKHRSHLPIIAITNNIKSMRQLSLSRGVVCRRMKKIEKTQECFDDIIDILHQESWLKNNHLIIILAGIPTFTKNSTNMIKIHQIDRNQKSIF